MSPGSSWTLAVVLTLLFFTGIVCTIPFAQGTYGPHPTFGVLALCGALAVFRVLVEES